MLDPLCSKVDVNAVQLGRRDRLFLCLAVTYDVATAFDHNVTLNSLQLNHFW